MASDPATLDRIELVVFDAGGVIVRTLGSWAAAQAAAGIESLAPAQDPGFDSLEREADRQTKIGAVDTATHTARLAAALGLSTGQVEQVLEAYLLGEYPGWNSVIDRLGRAGVATALLSNTNAFQWKYLAPEGAKAGRYPAIGRLDRRFASHHLRLVKPDPAIYAAVEAATGHRGRGVLFFDDKPENVLAARAFGWRAELIDPAADPAEQVHAVLDGAGL